METILFILLLIGAVLASILTRKLTPVAGCTGGFLALIIYVGSGFVGIAMLGAFFLLGTMATAWKQHTKQQYGLAETNKGRRTAGQVLANAGVATILSAVIIVFSFDETMIQTMVAACFSSATADTLSSELGNVYGKRFYNILTFKKDTRGLDGVISVEGTLAGLVGSIIIAFVFAAGYGFSAGVLIIIVAGTIGNLADSVIGASIERRGLVGNNAVNLVNTLVAALAAWALFRL